MFTRQRRNTTGASGNQLAGADIQHRGEGTARGECAHRGLDAAGAVSPIVPAKPRAIVAPTEPPPLPVWTAKRGEFLIDVLTRWGKTAGYIVISDTA